MAASATVYLEVDDEITSAASRIRGAAENRVALVVPYGSRLATSRINFRLLAREAQARGRRLSIVAGDAGTRALAASAGLPVFATVGEYEEAEAGAEAGLVAGAEAGLEAGAEAGREAGAKASSEPRTATPPPRAVETPGDAPDRAPAQPPTEQPSRRRPRPPGGAEGRHARPVDEEQTAVMPAVTGIAAPSRPAGATAAIPVVGRARRPAWPFGRTAGIVAAGVAALALLAVGVVAFLFLPSAEITITTRMERIGPVPLEVRADPGVTSPDPGTATVPAERLTFDVAVSDTFETTGVRVEEEAATGRVTFRSKDPISENTIARGATVATPNGIRFRTTAAVTIPKATIVGLTIVPGEASVGIVAVQPGPEGNVEPNAITVIPGGEDPTFTEVRNPQATTGGLREEFPQVSQEEVDAAIEQLRAGLDAEFQSILDDPGRVPEGLTAFRETAALGDALPTTDPAALVGTEVPEFTLGLATTGTVIAVDEAPIEVIARERISGEVDEGYELVDGSIEVEPGEPFVDGETITFPVTARAAQIRVLDEATLREAIKGKPIGQARTILEPYGLVDVRVWPDWVTAIPTLDSRLTIRVVPPGTDGLPSGGPSPSEGSSGGQASPVASSPGSELPSESVEPGLEGEVPPP